MGQNEKVRILVAQDALNCDLDIFHQIISMVRDRENLSISVISYDTTTCQWTVRRDGRGLWPAAYNSAERLTEWADLMVVTCLRADSIAKMLHGIADNFLLEVLRSWDVSKKIAMIPAMSRGMWENPMTRKQLGKIRRKWNWIRVLEPLVWHWKEAPLDVCSGWIDVHGQELADALANQVDLLTIGHDFDPTSANGFKCATVIHTNRVQLPPELWSIILEYTADWELSKALGIYTTLPVPRDWQRSLNATSYDFMQRLEWSILTKDVQEVAELVENGPSLKSLSKLCVKLIIKLARTDILSYLEVNHKGLFWSQFGHTLIPTKASAVFGQTAVLDWWYKSPTFLSREYNADAIDLASKSGFVHILQWWRDCGLPLRYTDTALEQASSQGHLDVLDWWRTASYCVTSDRHNLENSQPKSSDLIETDHSRHNARGISNVSHRIGESHPSGRIPLRLKVGKALICAAQNGQTAAIHWWMTSGIPTVHEEAVARTASANGHVNVLRLWKDIKGEKMQYDTQVLVGPTKNGHADVLDWWKKSGYRVEYKTCDIEEALEDSVGGERESQIRSWWARNGLNLGVGTSEWMKVKVL